MAGKKNIVAGVVEVTLDGKAIPVRDEAKFEDFGSEGEAGTGLDQHSYFIKRPKPILLAVTLSDLPDFDFSILDAFDGGTIVVKADNGKMWTMANASYIGGAKLDLKDGKYEDVKFTCSRKDLTTSTWS